MPIVDIQNANKYEEIKRKEKEIWSQNEAGDWIKLSPKLLLAQLLAEQEEMKKEMKKLNTQLKKKGTKKTTKKKIKNNGVE